MPGEIDPARRLLQAVCYPGHGVLLRRGRAVLASGEAAIVASLARVANERPDPVFTVRYDDELVACVQHGPDHTIAVLVPSAIDVNVVHDRMRRALVLYGRPSAPIPWTGGGGGGGFPPSGAPAELSATAVRRRPG